MSAKKPPHFAGLGHRRKLIVACLAIVCALVAVGLYAWQSQPVPEAGASVTTAEGKTRKEIQDELDAKEGEAYIEIQALDAKTLDSHGNPTRVKVRVEQAEN